MGQKFNAQKNIDFSQKPTDGKRRVNYPPVIYSSRDRKTCIICGKLMQSRSVRMITGYCQACLIEYLEKQKPLCLECGGKISSGSAGICANCYVKKRKKSAHCCTACGRQLKQRDTKHCRPCWFKELSKKGASGRIAAGRAMAWKSGRNASKIEIKASELLSHFGLSWKRQVPISRWIIDFIIEGKKIAIEVHGDYWHEREPAIKRDGIKRAHLEKLGYQVLFLKEKNIHFWWKMILDLLKSLE